MRTSLKLIGLTFLHALVLSGAALATEEVGGEVQTAQGAANIVLIIGILAVLWIGYVMILRSRGTSQEQ
jgi:hypothetical protein